MNLPQSECSVNAGGARRVDDARQPGAKFHKASCFCNISYTFHRMGPSERRRLFENVLRLRRAEREAPASRDIVAVRSDLERQLGETVSRSLAAQLLGVSHTALNRWIESGDVPVVHTPTGRRAVPVPALLELYEAVELERGEGKRRRHPLEPIMARARRRAASLSALDLVERDQLAQGHRRAELRGLAYHRAVASRLDRGMVADARHLIWQWSAEGKLDPVYAERWEELLSGSIAEIRQAIGEDSPAAAEQRQNSPFAGVLSEPERRRIIELVG